MKLSQEQLCLLVSGETEALALSMLMPNRKEFKKDDFKLHPDLFTADECQLMFRFKKEDLLTVCDALGIPETNTCRNGTKFKGIEGLCLMLYRLRYPNRYSDWVRMYGREPAESSYIFNWMLNFLYERHRHLLHDLNHWWMDMNHMEEYARIMSAHGSPLERCWGFLDGTVRPICRPTYNQRDCYNGHKKLHGLKFQSILTPNGMIANLFGPIEGRRHDAFMLAESNVLPRMQMLQQGWPLTYYLYGDSGYPIRDTLISPFRGNLSEAQNQFNVSMSRIRVSVEWGFGKMLQQFAFLDFRKNLKLHKQAVGTTYAVAAILTNVHTCLYGSATSMKFGCQPPSIRQYLENDENS